MLEIKRRGFLASMLAAAVAPAFVKSDSGVLMPVSSDYLELRRQLAFESGPKSLLRGDTLTISVNTKEGWHVTSMYDVTEIGVCHGVDLYGVNFPEQVPRGTAELARLSTTTVFVGARHAC